MPIDWNHDDIEAFFGTRPRHRNMDKENYFLEYATRTLRYEFIFVPSTEVVLVGCSFDQPFGADSLFEIGVPCDLIQTIGDGYYPEQTGLGFWYGDRGEKHNCTMQLFKRPDGNLKVWPACVCRNDTRIMR